MCTGCGVVCSSRSSDHACAECAQRIDERKRTILEILGTEESYSSDLDLIHDASTRALKNDVIENVVNMWLLLLLQEFYEPLRSSGLLSESQLATIFINLHQLTAISSHFRRKLASAVDAARARQDLVCACPTTLVLVFVVCMFRCNVVVVVL